MHREEARQCKNIEVRRGEEREDGPPVFRTSLGNTGLKLLLGRGVCGALVPIIIVIALAIFSFGPANFLFGTHALANETSVQPDGDSVAFYNDHRGLFIKNILNETEETWGEIFRLKDAKYKSPIFVRFTGEIDSPCGHSTLVVGPFYCPIDHKLYFDDAFFDKLSAHSGASGEFAQAYVIAHQIGHHVQNLTGVLDEMEQKHGALDTAEASALSVKLELQADCYAGVWAHSTEDTTFLDESDVGLALEATSKIGKDSLQKATQGYHTMPDSFTHGTSAERIDAFKRGYQLGKMELCDI